MKSIRKNNNILSSTEIKYRVRIAQESVERTCLSLRATQPLPSPRRFDFFAPRPCFVCPRPAGANSYIRIFADGSSGVKNRLAVLLSTRPRVVTRAGQEEKKEGGGLPSSSFLLQNRSEKEKGRKEEKKRRKLVERVGARDIGVCLLRTRPKNRALKAPRLLETLGATFSIGVWHGRMRRDNASWLPRMSIFSLFFNAFSGSVVRKACSLLISSSSFFFHFSFFFPLFSPFFCDLFFSLTEKRVPFLRVFSFDLPWLFFYH